MGRLVVSCCTDVSIDNNEDVDNWNKPRERNRLPSLAERGEYDHKESCAHDGETLDDTNSYLRQRKSFFRFKTHKKDYTDYQCFYCTNCAEFFWSLINDKTAMPEDDRIDLYYSATLGPWCPKCGRGYEEDGRRARTSILTLFEKNPKPQFIEYLPGFINFCIERRYCNYYALERNQQKQLIMNFINMQLSQQSNEIADFILNPGNNQRTMPTFYEHLVKDFYNPQLNPTIENFDCMNPEDQRRRIIEFVKGRLPLRRLSANRNDPGFQSVPNYIAEQMLILREKVKKILDPE